MGKEKGGDQNFKVTKVEIFKIQVKEKNKD